MGEVHRLQVSAVANEPLSARKMRSRVPICSRILQKTFHSMNSALSAICPGVAAGAHTLSVEIDQFPFKSGESVNIGPGSVMWIRAVPVQ